MHGISATSLLVFLTSAAFAPVSAATLADPAFTAILTVDGVSTAETAATANTPGDCDIFGDASGCDLDTGDADVPRLVVDWVDGDSFDLFFFGQIGIGFTAPVSVTVSALAFLRDGLPVGITGLALNRPASNLDDFLMSDDNPSGALFTDPVTSFGPDWVSATFDDYSGQLDGDGPRFRFDVLTSGEDVAAVPLPASAVLLAAALAGLGLAGRRRPG